MKKFPPFLLFIFILSGCVTYAPVQSPTPSKSKSDAKVEGVVAEPEKDEEEVKFKKPKAGQKPAIDVDAIETPEGGVEDA